MSDAESVTAGRAGNDLPDPLADLTRLAKERSAGAHGDAYLNVAADAWEAMRHAARLRHALRPAGQPPEPWAQLPGLPVVMDAGLPAGTWQLRGNGDKEIREQGRITASGSATPASDVVELG